VCKTEHKEGTLTDLVWGTTPSDGSASPLQILFSADSGGNIFKTSLTKQGSVLADVGSLLNIKGGAPEYIYKCDR
jgi:hypothetical protein